MEYTYIVKQPEIIFDISNSPLIDSYPLSYFLHLVAPKWDYDTRCCEVREIIGLVKHFLETNASEYEEHHISGLPFNMREDILRDVLPTVECGGKLMLAEYMASTKKVESILNRVIMIALGCLVVGLVILGCFLLLYIRFNRVNKELEAFVIPAASLSNKEMMSDQSVNYRGSMTSMVCSYKHDKTALSLVYYGPPSK